MTGERALELILDELDDHLDERAAARGLRVTRAAREAGRKAMAKVFVKGGVNFERLGATLTEDVLRASVRRMIAEGLS